MARFLCTPHFEVLGIYYRHYIRWISMRSLSFSLALLFRIMSEYFNKGLFMIKPLLYATAATCISLLAFNSPSFAQQNSAQDTQSNSDLKLDYEKFTLENGLEVILHVDKSDPIVAMTTVVHVGSNREKPGRTGFAHFFEHMAFNDSENVPRGWNRKAIPEWGGQRNGGTWRDGTIYFEVVPKDAFDKILWIDSDRLGYMINTVTTAALEREKQVVKNEKRQRVDNAPYGYTGEVISKALYPEGHPYNWSVIGSLPDLQAATLDDLKEFYAQYYGPNNATLSIAGDIDIAETKAKVQRWFGEIKRGQDIISLEPRPVTVTATKNLYFEDSFAKLPELRMTFPTVEAGHKDETALNILGQIIAGSKNSPLHKKIVEADKLAPRVAAFNNSGEIAGEFTFIVRARPGVDLDDVQSSIMSAFTDFETNGVDGTDLKRIKTEQETIVYNQLGTVLGKGRALATGNEFAKDPVDTVTSVERINAVSRADIIRVYNQYIKGKNSIITSFVPKGKKELAVSNAQLATVWIEEVKSGVASEEVSAGAVAQFEKTPSKYDRSEPPFGELPLIKSPNIWESILANDIPILGIENNEIPLVNYDITIATNNHGEDLSQKGGANLLARLLNEGTASKTSAQLEQAIGLIGAGINAFVDDEDTIISVTVPAKNFEASVQLVGEMLTRPRFMQDSFEREKSAVLTGIKGGQANSGTISRQIFNKLIYGHNNPLGQTVAGSEDSVSSLTLEDMKSRHAALLHSKPRFHISGAINRTRAQSSFAKLANVFKPNSDTIELVQPNANLNAKIYFIDVPGSKQSVLRIGKLVPPSTDADFNKIDYTNDKLGGGISGNLSQTLRIEKGYTYGAFSGVTRGKAAQSFVVSTSVRANATKASLDIIRDMLANYGTVFSDEDAEITRQKLLKENTRAFESLGAKRGILRNISEYGKNKDYIEKEQQELLAMTTDDFRGIANKYLQESEMIYLIVGDKETQYSEVESFAKEQGKGDVILLDIFGNPVKPQS